MYIIMFFIYKNGYSISRIKIDNRMQLLSVQQPLVNAAKMCLLLAYLYSLYVFITTECDMLYLNELSYRIILISNYK